MSSPGQQGFALITALVFVVIVGLLVATALFVSTANERNAADALRATQAQLAAEAGLEQAVDEVWYKVWDGTPPSTTTAYRSKVDKVFPNDTTQHFPDNSAQFYDLTGNESYRFDITRADDPTYPGVHFSVHATGRLSDHETVRYLAQDFYVGPGIFQGFNFALLTNNANCVFCHTEVKSVDAFKGNPSSSTPWNKARVGVLDTLQIRFGQDVPNNPDSKVAGTVYLRGTFIGTDSQAINDIGSTTLSSSLTPGDKYVTGSSYGAFSVKDCHVPTNCAANQNFYKNYPDTEAVNTPINAGGYGGEWPDGALPDRFPLPVPDTDGNRIIDDSEWKAAVSKSVSGNDLDNPKGSITGALTVNPHSVSGWPNAAKTTIDSGTCTGNMDILATCNIILDGRTTPLDVEGTVYINGGVIIRGMVKGSGKIIARGNVYLEGDLQYACGNQICTAADWADPSKLPKFALAAGGSMMVGDYETPWGADFTDPSVLEPGICLGASGPDDCFAHPDDYPAPSFTWREINLFNRLEIKKWLADSSYTPRLYAFRAQRLPGDASEVGYSDSIDFWNATGSEGDDSYGSNYAKLNRDCLTDLDKCPPDGIDIKIDSTANPTHITAEGVQALLQGSVIYNLSPAGNWISEESLKGLWTEGVQDNANRGQKALRTDGMLYSANAVFELSRPPNQPAPDGTEAKINGQWDLRGSLIAADTGILAPGPKPAGMTEEAYNNSSMVGLSLYHDYRLADFLKFRDDQDAKLFRSHWQVTTSDFK